MLRRLLASVAAASLLAACSSEQSTAPGGSPSIALTAATTTGSVARGASTTSALTLSRAGGYTGTVTLSAEGVPTGVSVQFAPSTLSGGTLSSVATIAVTAAAVPGSASITLRASGSGVTDKTVTFDLTIPTPIISLATGAATTTAAQGTSVNVPITITRANGALSQVTLTATGLPANVTAVFTPAAIPANAVTATMTLNVAANAALGASAITVRAAHTGAEERTAVVQLTVTAADVPAYTISAAPAALAVTAGEAAQTTLTLTKSGGFAGGVAFALEGAPAGVTAAFVPVGLTNVTVNMIVTTTAATPPGVYNLTVRGSANGLADRTLIVPLTVTAVPAFALSATNVSVAQGAAGTSAVTITRTGGFAGVVNLSAANVPANVNVGFNPAAAGGTSSVLTFTVGAGAAPGVYTVTVNGTGAGAANQSTTVTLTVTAVGGGNAISWQFCEATRIPSWFAYRDGANGAWTRVNASANNTYAFTITQAVGAVAFTLADDDSKGTEVYFASKDELAGLATAECVNNPASGKSMTGTVAGVVNPLDVVDISHGDASATASLASPDYSLDNVASGPQDLFAVRNTRNEETFAQTPNRLFLQRNVNVANGGVLPVVDFAGANAFAPATATLTIGNLGLDDVYLFQSFESANGRSSAIFTDYLGSGPTRTLYGVPTALLGAGELHSTFILASTEDGSAQRAVLSYYRTISNRTMTLGSAATAPVYSSTTAGGLARPKARAAIQAEYADAFNATFSQSNGQRVFSLNATKAYFGAATEYELETPNLAGVDGFNLSWGLLPGTQTQSSVTVWGSISGLVNKPADGAMWKFASKVGTFVP